MIKAEVQWLQRNDLTRLDYDARYAQPHGFTHESGARPFN